jgi:probable phosphoglycerate mutase
MNLIDQNAQSAQTAWQAQRAANGLDMLREQAAKSGIAVSTRRFMFLRHGETEGNAQKVFQSADICLNPRGREQALAAAQVLQQHPVQRIYASTMARAHQTAVIVGDVCNLTPNPEPGLRERSFGDLIGASSAQLDWRVSPPNGEDLQEFVARAQGGLEAALSHGEDTLVVAHGGNLYVLAFSLGIELTPDMVQNATPLVFSWSDPGWQVSPIQPDQDGRAKTGSVLRNSGW